MPKFFFSVSHGDRRSLSEEAIDLDDERAAWKEATTACGEILRDLDGKLRPNEEWRMDVNNENQELIFSLRLIPEVYQRLPAISESEAD
jgi:hypothetical protein